tara:strand:+ start:729 stop:917 length:189 start_codon:yes stop_codon:yes gene_type:complete
MMGSIEDTRAGGDFFDLLDKSGYSKVFWISYRLTERHPYPREKLFWPLIMKTELLLREIEGS